MGNLLSLLTGFFSQAWTFMAYLVVAIGLLAGLSYMLKTTAGAVIGANQWVWQAISGVLGIINLILFAFLVIPEITQAGMQAIPAGVGGPNFLVTLGNLAAGVIAALASLPMLKATLQSVIGAAVGGSSEVSRALLEGCEALFAMLIASLAVPIIQYFIH